ncbi:MAG: TIGR03758 family integrating conjugative element protein [Parahaliea sp.]
MPLMSTDQQAAFNTANPSAGDASVVYALLSGCMVVAAMLWFAWVCISAYRSLKDSGGSIPNASTKVVRALFILIVVIFLATP